MTLRLTENDPPWWPYLATYHTSSAAHRGIDETRLYGPCQCHGTLQLLPHQLISGLSEAPSSLSVSSFLPRRWRTQALSSPIYKDAVRIKYRLSLLRTHDDLSCTCSPLEQNLKQQSEKYKIN